MTAATTTATAAARPWISSPAWDGFWMMSGLWLLLPLVLLSGMKEELQLVLTVSLIGLWLAHRVGTTYLCATKAEYLPLIREQAIRFIVVPVAIFLLFLLFFFDPLQMIPLSPIDKAKVGLSAYFFINSYHFALQHYGVLSIYRARSRQPMDEKAKSLEKWFCVAVAGVVISLGLILKGSAVLDSTFLDSAWNTSGARAVFSYAAVLGSLTCVFLTFVLLRSELRLEQRSWPKTAYIASVGVQGVLVFFMDPVPFFILWAVQHWLVAIGLTTRMAPALQKVALPSLRVGRLWYGFWSRVNQRTWQAFLVLVAISVVMAPLFVAATNPEKLVSLGEFFAANGVLARVFLTLSVGSAFVHLNMDRAVFRFSNPAVRKVSLPLVFRQG